MSSKYFTLTSLLLLFQVADDGYGVSYIIAGEDILFFHISSKKSCSTTVRLPPMFNPNETVTYSFTVVIGVQACVHACIFSQVHLDNKTYNIIRAGMIHYFTLQYVSRYRGHDTIYISIRTTLTRMIEQQ